MAAKIMNNEYGSKILNMAGIVPQLILALATLPSGKTNQSHFHFVGVDKPNVEDCPMDIITVARGLIRHILDSKCVHLLKEPKIRSLPGIFHHI
jgi:hypothetical protein